MYIEKAIVPNIKIVNTALVKLLLDHKNCRDLTEANNAIRVGNKNQK